MVSVLWSCGTLSRNPYRELIWYVQSPELRKARIQERSIEQRVCLCMEFDIAFESDGPHLSVPRSDITFLTFSVVCFQLQELFNKLTREKSGSDSQSQVILFLYETSTM